MTFKDKSDDVLITRKEAANILGTSSGALAVSDCLKRQNLNAAKTTIVEAIKNGFSTPEMAEIYQEGYKRRLQLKEILSSPQRLGKPLLHPKMAEKYRQEVSLLVEQFGSMEEKSEAVIRLRNLIERIVLSPNDNKTTLNIDLYGDLAGILKLASSNDNILKNLDKIENQVKLVAGALTTFKGLYTMRL